MFSQLKNVAQLPTREAQRILFDGKSVDNSASYYSQSTKGDSPETETSYVLVTSGDQTVVGEGHDVRAEGPALHFIYDNEFMLIRANAKAWNGISKLIPEQYLLPGSAGQRPATPPPQQFIPEIEPAISPFLELVNRLPPDSK